MDTDFYRADVIFEHEFHEYFGHMDGQRIYRADGDWWTWISRISNIFGHTDTHSKFAENIRVIREIRVQK